MSDIRPEFYVYDGNNCFRNGQYEKALEYYEKALELDSEYAQAYYNSGQIYYIKALQYFDKATELEPKYNDMPYSRSNDYVDDSEEDLKAAIRNLEKAKEKDPSINDIIDERINELKKKHNLKNSNLSYE
ncbi:MAG: tetratricopeptide repeat protein [Cyanobacteriota bacterium]